MIQGPIYWAKITGKPQPGYDKRQLEWSFDIGLTPEAKTKVQELGVAEYIRPAEGKNGKVHIAGEHMKFKRREINADGSQAKPFRVVDSAGNPWPEDKRIGNGSIVNVKFAVNEKRDGSGLKPSAIAIQVWEYKPFEGGEEDQFPTRPNEEW